MTQPLDELILGFREDVRERIGDWDAVRVTHVYVSSLTTHRVLPAPFRLWGPSASRPVFHAPRAQHRTWHPRIIRSLNHNFLLACVCSHTNQLCLHLW